MRHGLQKAQSLWVYYGYLVNIIALSCNHGGDDRPDMDLLMRIEKDRPEVRPLEQKPMQRHQFLKSAVVRHPKGNRGGKQASGQRRTESGQYQKVLVIVAKQVLIRNQIERLITGLPCAQLYGGTTFDDGAADTKVPGTYHCFPDITKGKKIRVIQREKQCPETNNAAYRRENGKFDRQDTSVTY